MSEEQPPAEAPETKAPLAPAAALSSALKFKNKLPIAPVSVGVGIGSAALMAALLYAGRRRAARDRS